MRRREAGSDKAHQVVVSHVLHLIFPMRKYTIKRKEKESVKRLHHVLIGLKVVIFTKILRCHTVCICSYPFQFE